MGFLSFAGRVLFAWFFILSAYQEFSEFGLDGGPAAKALSPKYDLFVNHVSSHLIKYIVISTIVLRGLGGLLFIFNSLFGAYLLLLYLALVTPILFDFYNYGFEKPEFVELFVKFAQNLALFGATLFFIGIKNSMPKKQTKKKTTKTKTT